MPFSPLAAEMPALGVNKSTAGVSLLSSAVPGTYNGNLVFGE